jgi:hypothetical protein
VGRQPGGGVAVALLPVRRVVDGQQVERVVGEGGAPGLVPAERAGLPAVAERDDVVDVDAAAITLLERDGLCGVRVDQGAADHHAVLGARPELLLRQVAGQYVVAGVAAVAVDVGPGGAELVTVVTGLRRAALDREGGQHVGGGLPGRGGAGCRLLGGLGDGVRGRGRWGVGRRAGGGAEDGERGQRGDAVFHVEPPGVGQPRR